VQPHRETRRVAGRDGVCHVADAWEDSVETERWLDARVEVGEAWTPVRWRISAAAQRGVLEALVLPRWECEAAVRLPDGASAVDAGARVETWVEPAPDRWETMLHVRATLPGYRQLEASQPARDPLPCWYLRAGQD